GHQSPSEPARRGASADTLSQLIAVSRRLPSSTKYTPCPLPHRSVRLNWATPASSESGNFGPCCRVPRSFLVPGAGRTESTSGTLAGQEATWQGTSTSYGQLHLVTKKRHPVCKALNPLTQREYRGMSAVPAVVQEYRMLGYVGGLQASNHFSRMKWVAVLV